MRYDLVIFDFDGTLADSFPWFLGMMNAAADRFGFRRVAASEIPALRGYDARRVLKHVGLPGWKLPLVAAHMRRLQAEQVERIRLFPGADDMLRRLSAAGVTLAVVSSNSETNVRAVLGPENAALIARYACSTSLFGKAAKFRAVVRRTGVRPGRALCVGDEIRDIEAARRAGTASGAVAWGYADVDALKAHAPTEVFTRFEEIVDRVTA